jgi:hypothetical protein
MVELVLPDDTLPDDRLSSTREMVGRCVCAFDGSLEDALALAESLSAASPRPVLVNDVDAHSDEDLVDVHMVMNGRKRSVSRGVRRPRASA